MGIIQRQSLKFTIINFIATFIGFISVVFVYSLDQELYGYFQALHSYATLIVPVLGFGVHGAIVKYFPIFVQKNLERHFLSFSLVLATASAIMATICIAGLYSYFYPALAAMFAHFDLIEDNKWNILILGYIFLYSSIFLYHAMARYRIVIPDMINNLGLKLFLPLLILSVYFGIIARSMFVVSFILYFIIVGLALLIYLMQLDSHDLRPKLYAIEKQEYKGLFAFMAFSLLNGLGASFALKIDIAMIGAMFTKEAVGLYTIILTISNVMDIPSKAINQISAPVISASWANHDRANIQVIYQKSSLYGFIGGVFLFLILFFIWEDIMKLMPGKLGMDLGGILVIFSLISAAKISDLITGVNSDIISYSKYYKYHLYFLMFLGVMNVVLNYVLLSKFGITGAAIATLIAYFLFNLAKHLFVHYRFGLHINFSSHFLVAVLSLVVFMVLFYVPFTHIALINICLKSALTSLLFTGLIWYFNPGGEIRPLISGFVNQVKPLLTFRHGRQS